MSLPASIKRYPGLDTWIRIDGRRTITVFTGKVELGQGLRTAIARLAAEELDVSLERIVVETADTRRGLDEGLTAGSRSLEESGEAVRTAAAVARAHLLDLAGASLDVAVSLLRVADGRVLAPDGRSVDYWELLGGGRFEFDIVEPIAIKAPEERTIVGKPGPRIDVRALVDGSAKFVCDLAPPGLLHGRVIRPPSPLALLVAVAAEVEGATVVRDGSFLGVVTEREEQAVAAADRLRSSARWEEEPLLPPQRDLASWLREQPNRAFPVVDGIAVDAPLTPVPVEPDPGTTIVRSRYTKPFTMHGSIGPAAAVAEWRDRTLTVWCASQGIFSLGEALGTALEIPSSSIRVVHVPGPGCYGHNGADDAALDAALLARAVPGRPVRVQWSREDEHAWEPYGPAMVVELESGLASTGEVTHWNHEAFSHTHLRRPDASTRRESDLLAAAHLEHPFERGAPVARLGYHVGVHRNADPLYAVPNRRIVKHLVEDWPIRTSALRSLGAFANVFAIESFMDELAESIDSDPIEYRLRYLRDSRARSVLEKVAEISGWPGRHLGVAVAQYKNAQAYAAVVIEADVSDATAEITLSRAWIAADAGQVVDPDGLVNQLEGGLIQAASWTLKEEVKFDDTRITSVDWETYPILTFNDVPDITTVLLDRPSEPMLGAGEATQGPTPAAIANAVHRTAGIRLRDIPFTPARVRQAAAEL